MDNEAIVRSCARTAARSRLPGLTEDDAMQAGRIALWEAERDGRIPEDPAHAFLYRCRRARGAMLDQMRKDRAWHGQFRRADFDDGMPLVTGEHDAPIEPHDPTTDPVDRYSAVQAIEIFTRSATPLQLECATRLANGESEGEIARSMGVDKSAVSKTKERCRRLLAQII